MPSRLILPGVTRTPTKPQKLAGNLMLPPVSPPIAANAMSVATAVPLPLEEPPGSLVWSMGCLVVPLSDEVDNQPAAQSGMVDFPRITTPAALSFVTIVASLGGT